MRSNTYSKISKTWLMNLVLENVLSALLFLFWQVLIPVKINLSNVHYKQYNIEMKV